MKTKIVWIAPFLLFLFSCNKERSSSGNGISYTPVYQHIIVVILENHSFSQIVNNQDAPFINGLLKQNHTALFSNSHGITHPSQPNYIRFFSGASQGINDNFPSLNTPFTTSNLGAALIQKGYTFSGYCEDLPSVGYTGIKYNNYVRPLNPWVNWQGNLLNGIPQESNQPFSNFPADFTKMPHVAIVIPNLLHNMHDSTIAACDSWLSSNIKACSDWAAATNNLFILTFDEDDDSPENHILTLAVSKNINQGIYDQTFNHYNLLRTIEENFKLPFAGISADSSSIKAILP